MAQSRRRLHLSSFLGDKSEQVFSRIYTSDTKVTIGLVIKKLNKKELKPIPELDKKLEDIFYNKITQTVCHGWCDDYCDFKNYDEGLHVKRMIYETANLEESRFSGKQFCKDLYAIIITLRDLILSFKEPMFAGFIKIYDRHDKSKFTLFIISFTFRIDYNEDMIHYYTSEKEMEYSNSSEYILDIAKLLRDKTPNH